MPAPAAPPSRALASPSAGLPPSAREDLDRLLHLARSRFTAGRSPSTVPLAFLDWAVHAANAPFETAALIGAARAQWARLARAAIAAEPAIAPAPDDRRFANPAWRHPPFDLLAQAVLLGEEWWRAVIAGPRGVDPRNPAIVAFTPPQWLDLISPSNILWLNPDVIAAMRERGGANLAAGLRNLLRDLGAARGGATPAFVVGTEQDHIAPWRSVFKLHLLNDGDLTFVLTSGGHNAGIVSEPGHPRRHYRIRWREAGARTRGPDEWRRDTPEEAGSWWPRWDA